MKVPTFHDQTILVTGANRGIGLELSRRFHAAGARVIATARAPGEAAALADLGIRVEELDVTDGASVEGLARRLDGEALDVVVNNAGRGNIGGGIAELDFAEAAAVLDVNSLGPMRVVQALLPHLRRGTAKKIVHVSSELGSLASNTSGGYYAYRASKAALNIFHLCLAHELAPEGFTCVVLHPGWVQTDMGGPMAPLTPEESVRGLLKVIAGLSRRENGKFLDHTGATLRW